MNMHACCKKKVFASFWSIKIKLKLGLFEQLDMHHDLCVFFVVNELELGFVLFNCKCAATDRESGIVTPIKRSIYIYILDNRFVV